MAWNPSLHPRGPNGRFTKSFARKSDFKKKKQIAAVRGKFKAGAPFRSPAAAHSFLSGFSTTKTQPAMLGQLKTANQALRSGKPDQSGFEQLLKPTPRDVTAFRSVPLQKFGHAAPQDLAGFTVSDAGYFPTSLAPTAPAPGEVRMRIDVPAGTMAAASPDTSELVLDAGLEMSVDEVTATPDGSTEMHLTALPPDTEAASPAGPDVDAQFAAAITGNDALATIPAGMPPPRGLNDRQLEAYEEYRDMSYIPINRALRGGDPAEQVGGAWASRLAVQVWVENMDAAMTSSRLPQDVVTYRGIQVGPSMFGDRFDGNLEGVEWREDAFVSSSADQAVASDFAREAEDPSQAVILRMRVPAGVGAVQLSGDEYEAEALLERGLTMRVVRDNGGTPRQLDVEVVPRDAG